MLQSHQKTSGRPNKTTTGKQDGIENGDIPPSHHWPGFSEAVANLGRLESRRVDSKPCRLAVRVVQESSPNGRLRAMLTVNCVSPSFGGVSIRRDRPDGPWTAPANAAVSGPFLPRCRGTPATTARGHDESRRRWGLGSWLLLKLYWGDKQVETIVGGLPPLACDVLMASHHQVTAGPPCEVADDAGFHVYGRLHVEDYTRSPRRCICPFIVSCTRRLLSPARSPGQGLIGITAGDAASTLSGEAGAGGGTDVAGDAGQIASRYLASHPRRRPHSNGSRLANGC